MLPVGKTEDKDTQVVPYLEEVTFWKREEYGRGMAPVKPQEQVKRYCPAEAKTQEGFRDEGRVRETLRTEGQGRLRVPRGEGVFLAGQNLEVVKPRVVWARGMGVRGLRGSPWKRGW